MTNELLEGLQKNEDYVRLIQFFWYEHTKRDFKLMAANLARAYDKYITMENIKLYERMIRESAWWDISDNITPNIIGKLLQKFP